MVALSDVKRWNPAALNEVAGTLHQRVQVLTFSGDDFRKLVPVDGWSGPAADNAASIHQGIVFQLEKMTAGASAVGKALAQASDAIPAVQQAIANAEELAQKYGYQVGDTGVVIDTFCGKPPPDLHPEDRARACQEVTDDIAQALRTAEKIDKDLTSVLQRAEHGEFGTGNEATVAAAAADGAADPGLTPLAPPANGSSSQNAAWWATLSKAEQDSLVRDHPDWLGNLDGLPGAVRSQANLARIPAIRAQLQSQLDALNKQADSPLPGEYDLQLIGDQINAIEAKLHSLGMIQTTMAQGDRQLLFLDANQPRLEAAVAVGDVDTAQNVAVFTPGFTSTVDGSLAKYDQNMQNLKNMANDITDRNGGGKTATVAWIGYQAPNGAGACSIPASPWPAPMPPRQAGTAWPSSTTDSVPRTGHRIRRYT